MRRFLSHAVRRCNRPLAFLGAPKPLGVRYVPNPFVLTRTFASESKNATPHSHPDSVFDVRTVSTKVSEILQERTAEQAEIHTIAPNSTLTEAARTMMKERVGSLLVYDNHQCVGIVTERDFLRSTAMAIPMETPISRVMTSYENFHFAHTTDSISALMQTMTKRGVRHIPVQNTAGDIVGIVSIRDVVARLVDDHMEEMDRIQEYINNGYSNSDFGHLEIHPQN